MIWNDFHFYSQTLNIYTEAYVLLPDLAAFEEHNRQELPTLYLLHGICDDYTAWMRCSRIASYAAQYAIAVVMPAGGRSFYTDMAHGAKYETFISDELPRIMEAYFPLSAKREDRYVAGLSMGGYGALRLGLLKPERYAAAASISGPLMMQEAYQVSPWWTPELNDIFGSEEALRSGNANLTLLADWLDPKDAPRMYISCGEKDDLFGVNEAFVAKYREKFGIRYETQPDAAHNWDFWDPQIEKVLAWLPLKRAGNGF
ncbi:MAG: alpha/beta hydrolase family protein [Eubacteriales bacterium]|nr:alpha/beta hydrolase family protein [Eubacteriales bacterium]